MKQSASLLVTNIHGSPCNLFSGSFSFATPSNLMNAKSFPLASFFLAKYTPDIFPNNEKLFAISPVEQKGCGRIVHGSRLTCNSKVQTSSVAPMGEHDFRLP
ncbi:hypothetical protein L2E82_28816 [Cichorium intybus]|uniref:Uncharacterized protein n=1 Tax=Cichorium intybus TaxID=13427 RepID=A0ACB9CWV9_CICIN|nr:hypothetical protein L2E82_28816 [Cichorium intybus]